MGGKLYFVELTDDERAELEALVSAGNHSAQKLTRARILLKSDEGWSDPKIANALDCGRVTVQRTRERFSRERLGAIERKKPDRIYARKLDGNAEAHLIALACSEPPEGRARWTLHLLADTLVTLDEVDVESISHETVRQILKKPTATSPIPPVGDSLRAECEIRLPHGRCARPLPRTVRQRPSSRLLR